MLQPDENESDESSMFYTRSKSHVIAFDSVAIESDPLTLRAPKFQWTFSERGTFAYRCLINTWMKGVVEVHEPISKFEKYPF